MAELILPPPAQRAWIDHLTAELASRGDGAKVSDVVVDGRCVRVVKTGGADPTALVLARPQITIEAADTTAEGASNLLDLVSAIIFAAANTVLADGTVVYNVTSLGDGAWNPDTEAKRPKYTRTFVTGMRATAL